MLSERQLKMRRSGIGASECAVVPGFDPFATVWDLYLDKVYGIRERSNDEMRAGQFLEDGVARMYLAHLPKGNRLRKDRTRRHRERRWQLATIDRMVMIGDETDARAPAIPAHPAEIKIYGSRWLKNHETGEYELAWGYNPDEIPSHIVCQAQWQMDVLGAQKCDVVVFFLDSCELAIYPQHRNQRLIDSLVEVNARFWSEHVIPKNPPELDGSSAASRYLRERFPRNGGAMVDAPADARELARRYDAAARAEKAAEKEKDEVGNELRRMIGTNDGMHAAWGKATWKLDSRGKPDYKALAGELRTRVELLAAKARSHELEAAREAAVDGLVDDDAKVDEIDYDTVEALENMSIPSEDQLRGVTEALADEWTHALALLKTDLDALATKIIAAKQARL